MQTTIVGGLGLFVFALSTFTPTQRFGTLMLVLLAAALIGDLILLPALLAGPLGRWFKPRPPLDGAEPDGGPSGFGAADVDDEPHVDMTVTSESGSRAKQKVDKVQPSKVSVIHTSSPDAGPPEPKGSRPRDKRIST